MSELLQKARNYESKAAASIAAKDRPAFHLTPFCGWMNDPNGFSYYDGKYHLFYQYNPYDIHWNTMHWGHAVSSDLLHWEYLPAALAPDESYDCNGCFSGSAIELSDKTHLLIYTGVKQYKLPDGSLRDAQVQCLAVGDGQNYRKYEKNPVIDASKLPEGASKADFRDPRIWQLSDGRFCCAVASRPSDGSGQILLYVSSNGFEIEAGPKNVSLNQPFASFSFTMQVEGDKIHIHNRLLMKSGSFPKSQFPQLADFIRTINNIYNQKVVLRKK